MQTKKLSSAINQAIVILTTNATGNYKAYLLAKKLEKIRTEIAELNQPESEVAEGPLKYTDMVTPVWIREQMEIHKVRVSALVEAFGMPQPQVSGYITGLKPLSVGHKALFYYYFKSL